MERRQFRAPRGFRDGLPAEITAWRPRDETARRPAEHSGFREFRPALPEEVALTTRSVGEVTALVRNEGHGTGGRERAVLALELTPTWIARHELGHPESAKDAPSRVFELFARRAR